MTGTSRRGAQTAPAAGRPGLVQTGSQVVKPEPEVVKPEPEVVKTEPEVVEHVRQVSFSAQFELRDTTLSTSYSTHCDAISQSYFLLKFRHQAIFSELMLLQGMS